MKPWAHEVGEERRRRRAGHGSGDPHIVPGQLGTAGKLTLWIKAEAVKDLFGLTVYPLFAQTKGLEGVAVLTLVTLVFFGDTLQLFGILRRDREVEAAVDLLNNGIR